MSSRRLVIKANVVLPKDLARDRYVEFCFRTHCITVLSDSGELLKDCPVAYNFCGVNEGFFYSLDIPKTSNEIGTRVLVLYLKEQGMGIIIGCLPDGKNVGLDEEFQMKLLRRTEGNQFMIRGSGLRGVIDLLAQSDKKGGGKITAKAFNADEEGCIDFATDYFYQRAKKEFKISSGKLIELALKNKVQQNEFSILSWELGVGLSFSDEFGNKIVINKNGYSLVDKDGGKIEIKGGKVNLNGNSQKAVLGDSLKTQLNIEKARVTGIISGINAAVIYPGDGGASFKATLVLALNALVAPNYDGILSDKVKLD